jgi:signal transduction histidine kinase
VTLVDVPAERYLPDVEAAVYLAAAEVLANVAKHAQATCVRLELRREVGVLRLTVADDGVGGAGVARGSGLVGVADRAAALGGRLEVTSPPGGGTTVTVELPVPGRSADGPASAAPGLRSTGTPQASDR